MTMRDIADPTVVNFFTALFACTGGLLAVLGFWSLLTKVDAAQDESRRTKHSRHDHAVTPAYMKQTDTRNGAHKDRLQ